MSLAPSFRARCLAGLGAAAILAASSDARAIERQHHVGLAPQLAILSIEGKSTLSVGGGGLVHYAYGLSDQFNLMVEGGFAVVAADQDQDFPYSPRNRPSTVGHASAGVGYVIDILRWVPYVGLQGGVYRLAGGEAMPDSLVLPGVSVALGLDYQITRHFAVGVGGRQHLLFTKLDTYPSYTTVILRVEYAWGY